MHGAILTLRVSLTMVLAVAAAICLILRSKTLPGGHSTQMPTEIPRPTGGRSNRFSVSACLCYRPKPGANDLFAAANGHPYAFQGDRPTRNKGRAYLEYRAARQQICRGLLV